MKNNLQNRLLTFKILFFLEIYFLKEVYITTYLFQTKLK